MEFTLNNFQYKYQEERILKLSKSGKYCRWLHKNITNSKDYIYFVSKGKNYKIHKKTGDIYQHKTFVMNIKQTSNPVPSSYPSIPTPCIDLGNGSLPLQN